MSITFGQGIEGVTVQGKPEVIFPDFFVLIQNGIQVGTITGVFDFEGLDPSLHEFALQILQRHRICVALAVPRRESCPASPATDQRQSPRWSLWSKVKRFFAGTVEPIE